jgi:hypothetical protein
MTDKIILNAVSSFQNDSTATTTVNGNSTVIESAFNNTLSRDGTAPNQMEALLDMNSNPIVNLPAPISLSSPLRLQDAQTLNGSGTITVGDVPDGGTTGQVLTKASNADQDVDWTTPEYLPAGGTVNQVLSKNSSTDFDVSWQTVTSGGGGGGGDIPDTVTILDSFTDLATTNIGGTVEVIQFMGYFAPGDMAPFTMSRQASQPRFGGRQSADGSWWLYVQPKNGIDCRAFGIWPYFTNGPDVNTIDVTSALQECINFAAQSFGGWAQGWHGGGIGTDILFPAGNYQVSNQIIVHEGVRLLGISPFATTIVFTDTFPGGKHCIILGTPGNPSGVCAQQSLGSAGNLNINGDYAYNGAATFFSVANVQIFSQGNDSGITFTVHGIDQLGNVNSETVSGTNSGVVTTSTIWRSITSVSTSGPVATTCQVGNQLQSNFRCRIEGMELFFPNGSGHLADAVIYTQNSQHWAGIKNLKIFCGNRIGAYFDGGNGASYFTFEDIETYNIGGQDGSTVNPAIRIGYTGLLCPLRNIVQGGPGDAIGGTSTVGIYIDSGFVILNNWHGEGMHTGISLVTGSSANGALHAKGLIGNPSVNAMVRVSSGSPAGICTVDGVIPNGSTFTVVDRTGNGHTSLIMQEQNF